MKIEFFKSDNHFYAVEGTKVVHVNINGLINDLPFNDFISNDELPPIQKCTEEEFKVAVNEAIDKIGIDIYLN